MLAPVVSIYCNWTSKTYGEISLLCLIFIDKKTAKALPGCSFYCKLCRLKGSVTHKAPECPNAKSRIFHANIKLITFIFISTYSMCIDLLEWELFNFSNSLSFNIYYKFGLSNSQIEIASSTAKPLPLPQVKIRSFGLLLDFTQGFK